MGIWSYQVVANDRAADYYGETVDKMVTDLHAAIEKDDHLGAFAIISLLRHIGGEWNHIPIPLSMWKELRDFYIADAEGWEQPTLRLREVKRVFDIPCYEMTDSEFDEYFSEDDVPSSNVVHMTTPMA